MATLEEQAQLLQPKIAAIQQVMYKIAHICELVQSKHVIGDETYEYSEAQKQTLIDHYQTLKLQLQKLVEELP